MRSRPTLTAADVQKMVAACRGQAQTAVDDAGVSGVQSHEDEQIASAGAAALG
jgi:hypothetical protein